MVPDGNDWLEFDDSGTPLGRWVWRDGTWFFDPFAPLSELPQTGIADGVLPFALALALTLGGALYLAVLIRRRKGREK